MKKSKKQREREESDYTGVERERIDQRRERRNNDDGGWMTDEGKNRIN